MAKPSHHKRSSSKSPYRSGDQRSGYQASPHRGNSGGDRHQGRGHQKSQRTKSSFPLDPTYLTQRKIEGTDFSQIPSITLKSSTKSTSIYRKRIDQVDSQAQHGDWVRLISPEEGECGYGLWNPRAESAVRVLSWEPIANEFDWWGQRLGAAVKLRSEQLHLAEETNACRLVNAEGDGFPGLTADRFDDVLSVETFTLGMFQRAEAIAQRLAKMADCKHWVVRPGPSTLDHEGFLTDGFASSGIPDKVVVNEHDVRYEINPLEGQKTGFFCDQRDNRKRLREFCRGKRVLDLCCYSGGFALNAAYAGAKEVTAVDLDENAIRVAKRNAQLNQLNIKFVHADSFSYLRDMKRNHRDYDVIILDPPKFIRNREESNDGQKKYFDLNKLASELVTPGGLMLTCSCSGLLSMSEFTLTVRAATAARRPQLLLRSGAGLDHPVSLGCLETEYLKCLWMRMS